MVKKHIPRDYSSHRHEIKRPSDEFYKVEIFSYNHPLTQIFTVKEGNITHSNTKKVTKKWWSTFVSKDGKNPFIVTCNYFAEEKGEYRIDIVYELATDTAQTGSLNGESVLFDGNVNHTKRKIFFKEFNEGLNELTFSLPRPLYFYGVIVRKIRKYVGDSLDSAGTNLLLESVDETISSQINPKEAQFIIGYDNAFECLTSQTGLYMDYNDEVNIYLKKDGDTVEKRVFGGYLSSILPNNNKTELTVSCADRLIDGQNKYILSQMRLLGGATTKEDNAYTSNMDRDFETYGGALKYLCNSLEVTLKNNIAKNDLVTGETAKKGFNIEFGKNKTISSVTTKNFTTSFSKNFITLRNDSSAQQKQEVILYTAKDHTNLPPNITDYKNFGIVYGLGDPKTERKEKTTQTVENGNGSAGSQKFGKCGVSADKKYLMAIGLPSAGKDTKKGWTKTVFERKCPHCGSTNLIWDWNWGSGKACNGRYEGGSAEGHIFCVSCDADYSVQGWEHISGSNKHMTKTSSTVSSSKAEAQKLKNGEMEAVADTGVSVSSDDIFTAISNKAFKNYKYKVGGNTCSTWSCMKKSGYGDCWAFSEFIYNELKSYKVNCRVVEYGTSYSEQHRSVQYQDKKNKWVDFPYREYGWGTKYKNMLNNTDGSKNPNSIPFKYLSGGTIANAVSKSSSSTETTTVTITEGYDRDKPLQGYFAVEISTEQSFKAKTKTVYVGFTQKAGTDYSLTGFSPVWINNTVKQVNVDLLKFVRESIYQDRTSSFDFYLHSIKFVVPKNTKEDWFKSDNSTQDESSCKMDLYSINFNDYTLINPTDLDSCGKSVNTLFEDLLKSSNYTVNTIYAEHRCDDVINFSVDNKTDAKFIAQEGDENNILSMSGISFTPRSSLFNMSMVVFKDSSEKYKYVETKDNLSVLKYGEQTNLITLSEKTGSKEAYYTALTNPNYNPNETFNYTITLPFFVDVDVGDLVRVISNNKHLNTLKEVASVKYKCKNSQIPKVQTELGLGELPVDLQIQKELRAIREATKKETTHFSSSAEPIEDQAVYEWDN